MSRPVVPLPLGAYAARVLDAVAMRPGNETVIEAIARGCADQEAMVLLLDQAEKKGQPLPLHILESLRFAAAKNAGLCAFMLKRATDPRIAAPTTRSPATDAARGEGVS